MTSRIGRWWRETPNEDTAKTLMIALATALVCAFAVSAATIVLRPIYHANIERERSDLILGLLSGILDGPATTVARPIDLDSGRPAAGITTATFDARKAAKDPAMSRTIPAAEDIAGLGRLSKIEIVHEIRTNGDLRAVVLPVRGRGYASTLHGYLAIAPDGRTVQGLRFLEHGETPGIGGRVDDPSWLSQWRGRLAYDEDGRVQIQVIHGKSRNDYQVDAITGATYTSRGVNNLVRFWLGPLGFGPYLRNLGEEP